VLNYDAEQHCTAEVSNITTAGRIGYSHPRRGQQKNISNFADTNEAAFLYLKDYYIWHKLKNNSHVNPYKSVYC
jgi:hypothetical protein